LCWKKAATPILEKRWFYLFAFSLASSLNFLDVDFGLGRDLGGFGNGLLGDRRSSALDVRPHWCQLETLVGTWWVAVVVNLLNMQTNWWIREFTRIFSKRVLVFGSD